MKKKLIAIASFIMSLVMGVACLGGCNLITTDVDKDMQQVVATVSIEKGVKDNVYKQDVVMDYLNYGYYYVQYQGYTMEDTIELIVKSRTNTLILVQNAMKELNADASYEKNVAESGVWKAERYLSGDDVIEAKYNVRKNVNDLIESFAKEEDPSTVADTIDQTSRTTPTDAANAEKELTPTEMQNYLAEDFGFEIESVSKRREAFDKFVQYLKVNNLLGSSFRNGDLTTSAYYKDTEESEMKYMVLENYREHLRAKERAKYDYQDMKDAYVDALNEQKEWTNAEFVSALSSATVSTPVLYGANGKYGYVYNLLLGVDDIQTEKISAIKTDDPNVTEKDYTDKRNAILSNTRVTDLRTSWVNASYDLTGDFNDLGVSTNVKFTGDYTFTENYSLPYQGTVKRLTPADEEDAQYQAKANKISLNSFIAGMDTYMTTGVFNLEGTPVADVKDTYFTKTGSAVLRAGILSNVVDYNEKINELLFAFSTDDGSLNTHKGYVIKPAVDANNSEEFVETFANAGRELLAMGQNGYVIVASDYGYHVMFFSQAFDYGNVLASDLETYLGDVDSAYTSWEDYFEKMIAGYEDWKDDGYLYMLFDSLTSVRITNILNRVEKKAVAHYTYDVNGAVKTFPETYEDLLG